MSTENLLFLPLVLIAAWFVAAAAARSIARREIEKLRAEMEGRTAAAVPVPAAAGCRYTPEQQRRLTGER